MTISNILLLNNCNSSWAIYICVCKISPITHVRTRSFEWRGARVHYLPQHCALVCPPKDRLPWSLIWLESQAKQIGSFLSSEQNALWLFC